MTTAPTHRIAKRIAAAWRPKERLRTAEWCEENVRLPADFGIPGRYDLDDFPFWREPLESVDDPDCFGINLMTGTQIGKTEMIKAILASQSDIAPAPQMLVGPDKDYIAELREKILRTAQLNPAIADRIPPKRLWNLRWIDWGTCYCYLAWTGNTQRVSGKAVKLIVCSEVDRFKQPVHEGAIAKLIEERVKSFTRYMIVKESTPTDDASNIAAAYKESDQRRFHVPCPTCGHYQELRFFPHKEGPFAGRGGVSGMQRPDRSWMTPEEAIKTAYYVCEKGCRITSAEKPAIISRGVWCPKGQTVAPDGTLEGTPLRSGRIRGYQLGSVYSRAISFGRIAAAYLEARAQGELGLRNFFNNWLGLPFSVRAKVPKWRTLGKRLAGPHRRGTVPPSALFLTCGCDKQQDRCYYVVRAWGEGCSSWLVDYGVFSASTADGGQIVRNSDLEQLGPNILHKPFPYATPRGTQTSLQVRLLGVDCNFEPTNVWDWVRKQNGGRVLAVAGDPQMNEPFYRMNVVEKNARTGKPYAGGMKRWGINVDTYKADLQNRWMQPLDEAGAWWLNSETLEQLETYLRQITNEGQMPKEQANGRTKMVWTIVDPGVGNHYWDCEVYARALADMVVGQDWTNLEGRFKPQAASGGGSFVAHEGDGRPDGRGWLD